MNAKPLSTSSATSSRESSEADLERAFGIRGDYQRPESTQTLREGLDEYYRVNPGLIEPSTMQDAFSARYFHCHDTTHVIFGTHTGPLDEGVNDLFTMFGVEVAYWTYIRGFFKTSAAGDVAKDYQKIPAKLVRRSVFGTLRLLPRVWRSCRSMRAKWPWEPPEDALDRPLAELREEYGIVVWRPERVLGLTSSPATSPADR